jgi:hypothetical protein
MESPLAATYPEYSTRRALVWERGYSAPCAGSMQDARKRKE